MIYTVFYSINSHLWIDAVFPLIGQAGAIQPTIVSIRCEIRIHFGFVLCLELVHISNYDPGQGFITSCDDGVRVLAGSIYWTELHNPVVSFSKERRRRRKGNL